MRVIALMLFVLLNLQACSIVDDYILGVDNTIKPTPLQNIHPKVTLVKHWETSVGKPSHNLMYLKLKPVQIQSVVYTTSPEGRVSAISADTGRVLWTTLLHHAIVSGPTVGKDTVIVGTNHATLVALSEQDGHQRWEASLSEDALSKSLLVDDKVIAKSIDGHLYAFDLKTGKTLWMVEHGAPNLILRASSSPQRMGNLILVGYSDGKLDAIELETGRIVWQRSIVYANGASDIERLVDISADPVVRDHWIYLASYQGYIGAFNSDDGQFIWSKPASVYKNFALDHDTLYACDSRDVLWAYDLQTGQIKWKQPALKGHVLTEPVLSGAYVIVGDRLGYAHLLSKRNGDIIGREHLGTPIEISPLSAQKNVMFIGADGVLHTYSLKPLS